MVATADGRFRQAQIEADAYYEQQQRIAAAIEAEGRAEAKGITELNKALAGSGGEVMVKLKVAEALAGKRILLLPLGGRRHRHEDHQHQPAAGGVRREALTPEYAIGAAGSLAVTAASAADAPPLFRGAGAG